MAVYADRGNWYVTATDHRTETLRTFRVDRIESLEATGEVGEPTDEPLPEPGRWFVDGGMPRDDAVGPAADG